MTDEILVPTTPAHSPRTRRNLAPEYTTNTRNSWFQARVTVVVKMEQEGRAVPARSVKGEGVG